MKKTLTLLLFALSIAGCKPKEDIQFKYIPDFNWNVFDSLQYQNESLNQTLDLSFPHILYVSNNECAECIYNFIKFHKETLQIEEHIRYIYIITGYDNAAFTYYLKENEIHLKDNTYLIMDSLDIFHQNMSDYLGNQIFILKNNKAIQLLSNPIKNTETIKRFQDLIKKDYTTEQ